MSGGAVVERFLDAHGWRGAAVTWLAGDASARRYARVASSRQRAILMDMPPGSGLTATPFLIATRWLRENGFSAPEVFAAEPEEGLLLLEDLGDDLFAQLCGADPGQCATLYAAAIDLLVDLQRCAPPRDCAVWVAPHYDARLLLDEAALLVDWYIPGATGSDAPPDAGAEFAEILRISVEPVTAEAPVVVLRDFHAENLLWLPGRAGSARVGLLDYQDMALGHPAYDVVSLLEDARRDTDPELRAAMIARFCARSGTDIKAFDVAAHVLAAQRNLKILGIFARLCMRDRKPRYLAALPRVWEHLQRDLSHPVLARLRTWVAQHVPAPDAGVRARIAQAQP